MDTPQQIINSLSGYNGYRQKDLNTHQLAFLQRHLPYAERVARRTGTDPQAILAQIAIESAWGTHSGSTNGSHNYGNINEARSGMPSVWQTDRRGNGVKYRAPRRVFNNDADMYRYFNGLFDQNMSPARGKMGIDEYAQGMIQGGYAEDPAYAKLLKDTYNSVRLRMPDYQWNPDAIEAGFPTLEELAGEVNSGNWTPQQAEAFAQQLPQAGRENFGYTDPRPLQPQLARRR